MANAKFAEKGQSEGGQGRTPRKTARRGVSRSLCPSPCQKHERPLHGPESGLCGPFCAGGIEGVYPQPAGTSCRGGQSGGATGAGDRPGRSVDRAGRSERGEGSWQEIVLLTSAPSPPSDPLENKVGKAPAMAETGRTESDAAAAVTPAAELIETAGPGAGRILKYTFLFLASFFTLFGPFIPPGRLAIGRTPACRDRGRPRQEGRTYELRGNSARKPRQPPSLRPSLERAGRGLATGGAWGRYGWNGGVWHRFITPAPRCGRGG